MSNRQDAGITVGFGFALNNYIKNPDIFKCDYIESDKDLMYIESDKDLMVRYNHRWGGFGADSPFARANIFYVVYAIEGTVCFCKLLKSRYKDIAKVHPLNGTVAIEKSKLFKILENQELEELKKQRNNIKDQIRALDVGQRYTVSGYDIGKVYVKIDDISSRCNNNEIINIDELIDNIDYDAANGYPLEFYKLHSGAEAMKALLEGKQILSAACIDSIDTPNCWFWLEDGEFTEGYCFEAYAGYLIKNKEW